MTLKILVVSFLISHLVNYYQIKKYRDQKVLRIINYKNLIFLTKINIITKKNLNYFNRVLVKRRIIIFNMIKRKFKKLKIILIIVNKSI